MEINWKIDDGVAEWTEDDLAVPGDDSGQYVCPARLSESGPLAITVALCPIPPSLSMVGRVY